MSTQNIDFCREIRKILYSTKYRTYAYKRSQAISKTRFQLSTLSTSL